MRHQCDSSDHAARRRHRVRLRNDISLTSDSRISTRMARGASIIWMPRGFYSRYILPHAIDFAMRNRETTRLRASWIPRGSGEVLEVGIGSGLNLPFYSGQVQRIYGVDPSLELQRMARKRAPGHLDVEFLPQSAEEPLPLPDASIDTAVMTWTLCSIQVSREGSSTDKAGHQTRRTTPFP